MKHNLFIHTFCLLVLGFFGIANLLAQPQIEWQKSLGGSNGDEAYSIQQTVDGGYIIAGGSYSIDGDIIVNHGNFDYWILKLNSIGTIAWKTSLGGSDFDIANSIDQTADGGYIITGQSSSNDGDVSGNHGAEDYWIVKLNAIGTIKMKRTYGGSFVDIPHSIRQTVDGGYIIAGESNSSDGNVTVNHGNRDYWIVKLDTLGIIEWEKSFGGSMEDIAYSIQQTIDGGYIIAGQSRSNDGDITGNHGFQDAWVIKLSPIGAIEWQKALGGGGESAHSIQQTTDGGYIFTGTSSSISGDVTSNHGGWDCWIVKINATGTIMWETSLGGSFNDDASTIKQTSDGGYIVAGYSASTNGDVTGNHGTDDYWIVKLNAMGIVEWQKSFGGTYYDYANSIQQTADEGYIIAGSTSSNDGDVTGNHGNVDYWIVKLSSPTATEPPTLQNITISPNPTTGELYIHLENHPNTETLLVSITNLLGQTILQQEMIAPTYTLDIPTQPAGVYFLHIKQANGVEIVKKVEKL